MEMASIVRFHFLESFTLNNRTSLKQFIAGIFEEEGYELQSLDYIFCSDEYLLKINQDFLQHDDYTDIITFDLSDTEAIIGEVYISVPRVRENAGLHNQLFRNEILRVIFHGTLHLCGYKDKEKEEKATMTAKENYYLFKAQQIPS